MSGECGVAVSVAGRNMANSTVACVAGSAISASQMPRLGSSSVRPSRTRCVLLRCNPPACATPSDGDDAAAAAQHGKPTDIRPLPSRHAASCTRNDAARQRNFVRQVVHVKDVTGRSLLDRRQAGCYLPSLLVLYVLEAETCADLHEALQPEQCGRRGR